MIGGLLDKSKTVVDRVFTTSSKTKLIVTVAAASFVLSAPIPVVEQVRYISGLAAVFVLAQGFAEGLSKKYAPSHSPPSE